MTDCSDFDVAMTAFAVARLVTMKGGKAGKTGWEVLSPIEHVHRARKHIELWSQSDKSEPHLEHALTRLAMALLVTDHCSKIERKAEGS